jgi:SAM-dependent methyltransferase
VSARETYRAMAEHYDAWQVALGGEFAKLIAPRVLHVLRSRRFTQGRFLDLGTGTGSLLALFQDRPWVLVGVDASPEMLAIAKRKLDGRATFIAGRLDAIPLRKKWNVITCFYDTLNHITDRDTLAAAFREVSRLLAARGVFVFDTNNRHCYRTLWRTPGTVKTKSATISVTPHFDDSSRVGTAVITVSPRVGPSVTAELRERCYDDADIRALLANAGLAVDAQQSINPFAPGDTPPIKTFWVATRAGFSS